MGLSNDLITQFVKVTNDKKEEKKETVVYGTVKTVDGVNYVQLDGSELLTPVSSTTNIADGERVTVMIKNHTATVTGNITSPSPSGSDLNNVLDQISEFEIVVAGKVSTEQLEAESARIDNLISEDVLIKNRLVSAEASIGTLTADNATIKGKLTAAEADIDDLTTTKLDAEIAKVTYATITNLDATNAEIHTLKSDFGTFEELSTNTFSAHAADIENLKTNKLDAASADLKYANIHNLQSDFGTFEQLTTNTLSAHAADIKNLKTNVLTAESADLKYANIDFTNITEASVENLFAKSGMIKDLVMSSGSVTGELVGVKIKGDLIEAGTLKADKLVVLGTDGLYYKLNVSGSTVETEQTQYNSINGSIITAQSITANKIHVDDLKAFNATIGGFKITDNSIYSGVKSSINNTTRGIYLDTDGQIMFGDTSNFVKFYKDTSDSEERYKLDISVSNLLIGSSGKSVELVINSLENQVNDCVKTGDLDTINSSIDERIESAKTDVITNMNNKYVEISEIDKIYQTVQTMIEKSDEDITFTFQGITSDIQNEIILNQHNFERYIRFSEEGIELGEIDSPFKTNISNTEIYFSQSGKKIAYISNSKLYILEAEFINKMSIGSEGVGYYDWVIRKNGHLSLKLRGGAN